jgi:enamine deaminase RidA (YjgF/YER057c/UK114 family)
MEKKRVSTGTVWEQEVGYSRAVRFGNRIEVSGTVAVDESGQVVREGNPAEQTRYILKKIEQILTKLNASLFDVIRTRIYVTDMANWEAVGYVHGEVFKEIRPATSLVEVSALIRPEYLVEIEVSAYVSGN